jgi:hypothetical protein
MNEPMAVGTQQLERLQSSDSRALLKRARVMNIDKGSWPDGTSVHLLCRIEPTIIAKKRIRPHALSDKLLCEPCGASADLHSLSGAKPLHRTPSKILIDTFLNTRFNLTAFGGRNLVKHSDPSIGAWTRHES